MPRRNLFWLLGIATLAVFGLAVSYSAPTREKDKTTVTNAKGEYRTTTSWTSPRSASASSSRT